MIWIAALYTIGFLLAAFGLWLTRLRANSPVCAKDGPGRSFSSLTYPGASASGSFMVGRVCTT